MFRWDLEYRRRPDAMMGALLCALLIGCGDQPTGLLPLDDPPPEDVGSEDRGSDTFSAPPTVEDEPAGRDEEPAGNDGPSCADSDLVDLLDDRGEGFAPAGSVGGQMPPCTVPVHWGVAALGMSLEARLKTLDGLDAARLLRFESWPEGGAPGTVAGRAIEAEGEAVLQWIAPRTGQYALAIDTVEHAGAGRYALEVQCVEHCELGMTRYPIVLLHGMGGADVILDLVEYFSGVEEALEEAGYDIRVTVVDPLNSSSVRAEQLAPQLEAILLETGARRLNLIGHSQGGIDGRAVIVEQDLGDRVASLTTLATPHRGVVLADLGADAIAASRLGQDLTDAVGDVLGWLYGRGDQATEEATRQLGETYMTETFNPSHPDDARVAYYSWNGHTCSALERDCVDRWDGEVVTPFLAPTYRALQLLGHASNDGLVPLESARWGEFLGEIPGDHMDEVGISLGSGGRGLDHIEFFLDEGARLFAAGH